ncbi:RIP metalloprotease RseP [Bdellovibrio sp. HCB337]|uniref:RIP metalloprotease RseP n=1 Tax=Bdellovibrio sp. HCB337 TaxID=3394358 RepID=UPI0039A57B9D
MEILISLLNKVASGFVPFVILLGVLIFIHEFGHFIIARLCGVRVEVFSLGFGKKIFQYKRGDTNYCVSIIPLGGYVKMFGDQPGAEVSEEDKKYSFTHKNVWQRISIVLAGPLMNFFFAIFIFFVVAFVGEDYRATHVGDLTTDSKAYAAGFRSGDMIKTVNGAAVKTWEEFEGKLANLQNSQAMVDIERGTEKLALKVDIASKENPNVLSTKPTVGDIEGLSPMSKAALVGVKPDSALAALGLKTGDRVTAINGEKIRFWRELEPTLEKQNPQQALQIDVERAPVAEAGKPETMSVTLAPMTLPKYSFDTLKLESADLYLGAIIDGTPAKTAGLLPGDRIMQINETKIDKWDDVITSIKAYDGKEPVKIQVLRGTELLKMNIVPHMISQMTAGGTEDKRYTIGVAPFINYAMPELIEISTSNPVEAIKIGVQRTWDVSVMTVMSFVRLFEGKVSPKNIGGVISIGQAASETFKIGISPFLRMMGLISVNLFILNLLPIPVLDGGHLLFYSIEALKGAPISIKNMEIAQQVGLVLLMSLMVFALFNDFTRLFGM